MIGLVIGLLAASGSALPIEAPRWVEIGVAVRTEPDPKSLHGLGRVAGYAVETMLRDTPRARAVWRVTTNADGLIIRGGSRPEELSAALDAVFVALSGKALDDETAELAVREAGMTHMRLRLDDRRLAYHELMRVLFDGHPAGTSVLGEIVDLASITTADVRAYLKRNVTTPRVLVVVAGQLPENVETIRTRATIGLPKGSTKPPKKSPEPTSDGLRVVVIDKPDRNRAEATIGWTISTATITSPAFEAVRHAWRIEAITDRQPATFVAPQIVARRGVVAGVIEIASRPRELAAAVRTAIVERRTINKRGIETVAVERAVVDAERRHRLSQRDAPTFVEYEAYRWLARSRFGPPDIDAIRAAHKAYFSSEALVLTVVASATPTLLSELAALPGVESVSVVAYDNR